MSFSHIIHFLKVYAWEKTVMLIHLRRHSESQDLTERTACDHSRCLGPDRRKIAIFLKKDFVSSTVRKREAGRRTDIIWKMLKGFPDQWNGNVL